MKSDFFRIGTSVGKYAVENTDLQRDEKEFVKAKLDIAKELIDSLHPQPIHPLTIYGFDFQAINKIKYIASQYAIDKVILFPVFYTNGNHCIHIRVYGEEREKVFQYVGGSPLYNVHQNTLDVFYRMEKEYGVVIYEKD